MLLDRSFVIQGNFSTSSIGLTIDRVCNSSATAGVDNEDKDCGFCGRLPHTLGPLAQRKSKRLIIVRSRYRNSQGPPFLA